MKSPILAFFLALSASGATITVCASGCDYPTAQAALNASDNGDTIVLTAGQNLGSLTIPGNRHDLTIKSSAIDGYPRNYRITRNNPALARLTTVTIGDFANWGSTSPGSPTLTTLQAHGLNVGDTVTVGGTYYSAYVCASVNQPPYVDGACDSSRVGFMNIRADTHLGNGSVLYFKGRTLPTPLLTNTPYYIVNFTRGGSSTNADKFQLATTPGGSPIFIPQFNPEGQDLVVDVAPLPQQIGDTMYVVATPSATTLQLSATPGGAPTVWAQIPYGYNGGGFSSGFSITKTSPDYNLTFDGIEVSPLSDSGVYYPFYVSRDIASMAGEPHNITIWRSWIHGADDQEDFPMTTVNIAGHDIEIGWSVIENAYSTANDTQDIGFMSTANVSIHDNELKGATEGILSGGNLPWFAFETNTTGISVYRNYIWKPLKAYTGIVPVYVSPTQFQLLSRYQQADCSSVAGSANLGYRCFAYEAQETPGTATPPSAAVVSRTEWDESASASTFSVTGSAGQKGYLYLLGGVFYMDHNFSGSVSCPSGIACTFVAAPSFPVLSTRIGIEVMGSDGSGHNYFDSGSFYQENRNVWSKNLLESKYGDGWLIEGNVFHRQSNCDNGSTCQDPAIQFTLSANGSGSADPVNYLVSSSNSIIRNNVFRMLSAGVVAVGKTFAINTGATGLNWEFAGFGQGANNTLQNNLFMDLGSTEYQAPYDGAVFREQDTQAFTVQHNTALDVRIGFLANPGISQNVSSVFRSNVVTPYRSACPGGSCNNPAATSEIGVQDNPGPPPIPYFGGQGALSWSTAVSTGLVDATSAFDDNLLMNRPDYYYYTYRPGSYPLTTWLIQPSDPGQDPNTLFTTWQERDNTQPPNGLLYRAGNYRLAPGQAALYPAYDSRTIGADIDEIEALTGQAGVDVENGWPTFAQRVVRTISTDAASAVISYLPNGSTCTIEVWPNSSYSGAPAAITADSANEVLTGLISVTISGLNPTTAYYGKRWCGAEVDVFSFTTQASATVGNGNPVSQNIMFPALSSVTLGTAPFTIPASASSGLPVTFTSTTTAVCTLSGATVTIVGAGICTIAASQAGNANYLAATSVANSFVVNPATQTITFPALNDVAAGAAPFTISAATSSGLPVTLASTTMPVCTVLGDPTVTIVASGICTITANQPGNANYLPAASVTQSFTVQADQVSQAIAFGALTSVTLGVAPFTISATASSGLPVTFSSASPAVCTVAGSTVTVLSAGTCSITAGQSGNVHYVPAGNVTQTFAVNVSTAPQTIGFGLVSNVALGSAPFALTAAASSGLTVAFASTTPAVCTVIGATVTVVAMGTCSITASQAGNINFLPAATVAQSFTVTGVKPSEAGIFRQNFQWLLDANGNRQFDGAGAGLDYVYANFITPQPGDIPMAGDWSGSGTTKIGIYRPSTGQWFLDYNGNGVFDAGDETYNFGGVAGDIPVVGDWNGSGFTKIGIFRSGYFWLLDFNGDGVFDTGDQAFPYGGEPGDVPITGDWNGDGRAKVGIVRPFATGGAPAFWILDANDDHTVDAGDLTFAFGGLTGDVPVTGDWNGSGTTKVGVFRQGFLWVVDQNGSAPTVLGSSQLESFGFGGVAGDVPVVGKWYVNPEGAPGSPANLIVTKLLTRIGGNIVVQLTIGNTGGTVAANVVLSTVTVGGVAATPLPVSAGTIGAGTSVAVTVSVPGSVGASGAASSLILSGSYTGGTFSSSARITLP